MKRLVVSIVLLLIPAANLCAGSPAHIAIVIDDLGHNYRRGIRAIELPAAVTLSILPHTRHSRALANAAADQGKEVMVHLPMANMANLPTGPGGLDDSIPVVEFRARIARAIARVPHARGINNHMGSYLTQQPTQMQWLMDELSARNLFFIDSRTTPLTVARQVARRNRLLSSSRDVFLDNVQTYYEIDRAFRQLVKIARMQGTAIAIAHPHAVTLHYLELALPLLAEQGITLLPASSLLALQEVRRLAGTDLAEQSPRN